MTAEELRDRIKMRFILDNDGACRDLYRQTISTINAEIRIDKPPIDNVVVSYASASDNWVVVLQQRVNDDMIDAFGQSTRLFNRMTQARRFVRSFIDMGVPVQIHYKTDKVERYNERT